MFSAAQLVNLRLTVFGITGGICIAYAALALASGRPDPMPFWIPGAVGVVSALTLFASARMAGRKPSGQAFDEGFQSDNLKAQRFGFWCAVAMYPIFGALQIVDAFAWEVVFASMGTLTGASYLLAFVWNDIRGR